MRRSSALRMAFLVGLLGASGVALASCVGEDATGGGGAADGSAATGEAGPTGDAGPNLREEGGGGSDSGGDAPAGFRPTDLASCALWLRADLGVTKNPGGQVTLWADQSAEGDRAHDLVAGSNPPMMNAFGGQPAISFTSTNSSAPGGQQMTSRAWQTPLAAPITYYAVFRTPGTFAPATEGVVFDGIPTLRHRVAIVDSRVAFTYAAGGIPQTKSVELAAMDRIVMVTVVYDQTKEGSSVAVKIPGLPQAGESLTDALSFSAAATQAQLIVGAGQGETKNLQGSIAEIIAYRVAHPTATREIVQSYLAARYGL